MERKKPKGAIDSNGRIRFHAAKEISVIAQTARGAFKLLKIVFQKNDGSIYVPFASHGEKRGLLSEVDPASEPDPRTINLRRNGIVVEHDVKCSFHTSGVVHFSKDGGTRGLPERKGFPLAGPGGKLFEFHCFGLDGLEPIDLNVPSNDYRIRLRYPGYPAGIAVTAFWSRKTDVESNSVGSSIGPTMNMISRATSEAESGHLIGQPQGFPLRDHVIVLTTREVPQPTGADSPTMVFFGGWSTPTPGEQGSARMLAFIYPVEGAAVPDTSTGAHAQIDI